MCEGVFLAVIGLLALGFLLWVPWESEEEDVKSARMY